uniref:DUF7870 domain-containing protein n=1 Tax=Kalanchoe fedtschenkoi TaxID=63787 RepID=A0A7N0V1T6_KALFE
MAVVQLLSPGKIRQCPPKNKQARVMLLSILRSRLRRFMSRFLLLTLLIVSFPWIGSVVGRPLSLEEASGSVVEAGQDGFGFFLPLVLRDLRKDGVVKGDVRSLIVAGEDEKSAIYGMMNGEKEGGDMEMVSSSDVERRGTLPEEAFDVAFVDGGSVEDFVDRSLKPGGVAAVRVSDESAKAFQKPNGYRTVYLRRFSSDSVIVAMKKTSDDEEDSSSLDEWATHRRLLGFPAEARRAALKKLEDVLLEPPRASSGKSRSYQKRTRYLPDLLGDSLESYPRRVFIDVGLPEKDGSSWLEQNYPTRNLDFHKYKIETVQGEEWPGKEVVQTGMSDWVRRNVREEEYVVMKAEAEAVEEMVKSKAIRLIDELFLECRPRGLSNNSNQQNRRAYWECLALYGKLRDEGVAVHQWWG